MDRLYQRYADPFHFMEIYLTAGRFAEWMRDFVAACNHDTEQRQDELLLQIWLHKYDGRQSFGEWKNALTAEPVQKTRPKAAETDSPTLARNLETAYQTLGKLRQSGRR